MISSVSQWQWLLLIGESCGNTHLLLPQEIHALQTHKYKYKYKYKYKQIQTSPDSFKPKQIRQTNHIVIALNWGELEQHTCCFFKKSTCCKHTEKYKYKYKTRLRYNCAHLRSKKESLAIWVKNFVWVKIFWVKNFVLVKIFWVKNFLKENFLGEIYFGWKIFLVKNFFGDIFLGENFLGENFF